MNELIPDKTVAVLGGDERWEVGSSCGVSLGALSCPDPFLYALSLLPICHELKKALHHMLPPPVMFCPRAWG
jgi:hypothetical protein